MRRSRRPAVAVFAAAAAFLYVIPINYAAFTNGSLTMMYEAVRGALAADDVAEQQGPEEASR